MSGELRHGCLDDRSVHLCIDMQCLFAAPTDWQVPWMQRVLPTVLRIARAKSAHTIFTRFVPPSTPDQATGAWRRYYERWQNMTRANLDPRLIELLPPLAALVPPAVVLDKPFYSPFASSHLHEMLQVRGTDTLVITGGETDVCVLAAVMDAVDAGYRVVLGSDAVCSVSDHAHDALLRLFQERFSQQIEVAPADAILAHWE